MPAESHSSRICAKCGGQLQPGADACPWCHAPVTGNDHPQRIRVRKKRSLLKTYFEHVRRHWIYFFLAILAGLVAAWFLLDFAQRPSRQSPPAPSYIIAGLRLSVP
jgi:hypothetical protein